MGDFLKKLVFLVFWYALEHKDFGDLAGTGNHFMSKSTATYQNFGMHYALGRSTQPQIPMEDNDTLMKFSLQHMGLVEIQHSPNRIKS